jgi:hypothetical protein
MLETHDNGRKYLFFVTELCGHSLVIWVRLLQSRPCSAEAVQQQQSMLIMLFHPKR